MDMRILIIGESEAERGTTAQLLRAMGCAVLTAENGEEGASLALRAQPDLVFCSIGMQDMDGFAIARCLRALPGTRHIPLVALGPPPVSPDDEALVAKHFDSFLATPIDPHSFADQLAALAEVGTHMPEPGPLPARPPNVDAAKGPAAGGATAKQAGRWKILMIDDIETNIELFARSVETAGYETIPCMKSEQAETLARLYQPDLVVCDIIMPNRDGFAVLKAFKSDPQLRKIPFALISASRFPDHARETGLKLGAVKFIHRPIDPRDLAEAISGSMSRRLEAVH